MLVLRKVAQIKKRIEGLKFCELGNLKVVIESAENNINVFHRYRKFQNGFASHEQNHSNTVNSVDSRHNTVSR